MKKGSETWLAIGIITLVTLLTYGVLIPQLGFYRDDWYLFSTAQSQGPAGIVALFQIDRPLVGYLYAVGFKMLGLSPLAWHVAALLFRLAGNLALFGLLRLLWPDWQMETLAVTLLFSVYPGFTVQPNAGVYISDLLASAAAIVSIALAIKVVQDSTDDPPARPWVQVLLSALAGLLTLFYLGIFEAAIGLEAARFALIWYVVWRRDHPGFKFITIRALKADWLYLFVSVAFLIWRLFFFHSTRRATNLGVLLGKYGVSPLRSVVSVIIETFKDILETTVFAWMVPFYQYVSNGNYRDLAIAVGIALLAVSCIYVVFRLVYQKAGPSGTSLPVHPARHLIWLGLFIVVFALIPIDAAGRNVLFSDQWDRYTIYASMGVAMVIGGMIFHFFQEPYRKGLLFALIGMSVIVHFFSAAWYRDFWAAERDLWQQMAWRVPGLRPGTMLFAIPPFAGYEEGYEIYGPANMIYYPGQGIQVGGEVLNSDTAANIQLQKDREHYDRSVLVPDNYQNILIAVFPGPRSCLHVLDGRKVELPGLLDNSLVADIAPYSRIGQIDTSASPVTLPAFLSGEHPKEWCSYYQKMDLARQQGNWQEVASLADESLKKGLTPDDASEWMPALEAYATLGRLPDARHAASIIRASDKVRSFLCLQLQRGAAYPAPYNFTQVDQLLCQN